MSEAQRPLGEVLADRVHRHSADPECVFMALTDGLEAWMTLHPGEQFPTVLDQHRPQRIIPPPRKGNSATHTPGRVLWSSFWPVSPDDTVELTLQGGYFWTNVRFVWRSPIPPDDRGIAITRQRLNLKLGGQLRNVTGWAGGE